MARPKSKKKPENLAVATPDQIKEWKQEIMELEGSLKGGSVDRGVYSRNDLVQEPELIRRQIAKNEALIKKYSPRQMKGQEANRAYARAKELAAEIKESMPSQREYFQRGANKGDSHKKVMDFERAVQKQVAFQSAGMQRKVEEYRHIMARLDPSNPMVRSIETLRRAR